MKILGVDFTSAPTKRKSITVARGSLEGSTLHVARVDDVIDFAGFEALLAEPGPWIGGFDFPFGLPRRFVERSLPSTDWSAMVRAAAALGREGFSALTYDAFRAALGRPEDKHREVDGFARAHSPLKTMDVVRRRCVNPPVGLMFFEGAPRLEAAGVRVPTLRESADARVALEAYPGWLARSLGERHYKNDRPKHGRALAEARLRILDALAVGDGRRPPLVIAPALRGEVEGDRSGDRLDAILCAVQAAAASALPRYGFPARVDPLEGWIAGVPVARREG